MGLATFRDPDVDRGIIKVADGQVLQLVVELFTAPGRLFGAEADIAILVVGQVVERLGHIDLGCHEFARRKAFGQFLHVVGSNGFARVGRRFSHGGQRPAQVNDRCESGPASRHLEKIAAAWGMVFASCRLRDVRHITCSAPGRDYVSQLIEVQSVVWPLWPGVSTALMTSV